MPAHRTFDRERAAKLIMESLELGISPALTIAQISEVSMGVARYQVRKVREEGLLGVPPHKPTRVHLHPGAKSEVVYLACNHCRTPWPCEGAFPYGLPMEPLKPLKKRRRRQKR